MIKVLLADDHKTSLAYLTNMIDWQQYGFQIVTAAIDGEDAFEAFQKYKHDLVITDIDMPVLSGIALAAKINEIAPDTVIVFLSSYSEFSYARSALKLNVFDYLLKQELEKNMLVTKLNQIKTQIHKTRIQNRYLLEGALSALFTCPDIEKTMQPEYKAIFPGQYDFVIAIHDHTIPVIADKLNIQTGEPPENEIKALCYEASEQAVAVIKLKKYHYLLLLNKAADCYEHTGLLKARFEAQFEQSFSFIMLSENTSFRKGIQAYCALKDHVERIYFYPVSTIIHGSLLLTGMDYTEDLTPIAVAIRENEIDRTLLLIDKHCSKAIQAKNFAHFSKLTDLLLSEVLAHHMRIKDIAAGSFFTVYDETTSAFWKDALSVFQWIKQQYLNLKDAQARQSMPVYPALINTVVAFIHENLDNSNLTIEVIAKHFEVSPGRINDIFKRETGHTVWHMITTIKMTTARKLIEQNKLKVNDICRKTGYTSLSYFSKVFKKTYGVSPQHYRKRQKIGAE